MNHECNSTVEECPYPPKVTAAFADVRNPEFPRETSISYKCLYGKNMSSVSQFMYYNSMVARFNIFLCCIFPDGDLKIIHGDIEQKNFRNHCSMRSWCINFLRFLFKGYIITGNPDINCRDDLTWSTPTFSCTKLNCGDPGKPIHGYLEGEASFLFGTWVVFKCDKGYYMEDSSKNRRFCSATGKWTGSNPNCLSE